MLDPVFIYGFGMGVRGAALATVVSQALSTIWVLSFLLGKKTQLKIRRRNMRLNGRILLPCVALGISPFVMQASESVIMVCFNSSLLKYGGNIAVGAMTILSSVMQFSMLPLQGLGQGAQPISSYNYGAGNVERVKKTFKLLLLCSVIYAGILWGAVMRKFVLLLPLIYLLPHLMSDKTMAVYTAEPVADFLAVTFTVCLFAVQFKKALKKLG